MSALGCPLSGDVLYGADDEFNGRVYLHSWKLEFQHPVTNENLSFRQNVPDDFMIRIHDIVSS
jgi:23S rRNA pseudouridine1911/1915/1917 synthase